MAAPVSVDDFLTLLRRSEVVEEGRLAAYLAQAKSLPVEPGQLAQQLIKEGLLTSFQADLLLKGKSRGFFLGNYKVLERLGAGGMAIVYLCEHKAMRRRVAIKVLPVALAKDDEYLKRFQREARAVAALEHPNIVRAYDVGRDKDLHFLVMEYIEGRTLQELVNQQGPLEPLLAAGYAQQAARGLQHAHEAGLVHRDIKPSNLILDPSGTIKMLDMGLARFEADTGEVLTKGMVGTPEYLAPEQADDSHAADIRADIYSLGCTLYFMLTGQAPFPEGSPLDKILAHATRQAKPLSTFRSDVPAELESILGKMMAKDMNARWQNPREVVEALAPWASAAAPPAAAPGSTAHETETETEPNVFLTPAPVPAAAPPGLDKKPVQRPAAKKKAPHLPARRTKIRPAALPSSPQTQVRCDDTRADAASPAGATFRWRLLAAVALALAIAAAVGWAYFAVQPH
jgi:eukaryotic-like serine/threonine-protein kinase